MTPHCLKFRSTDLAMSTSEVGNADSNSAANRPEGPETDMAAAASDSDSSNQWIPEPSADMGVCMLVPGDWTLQFLVCDKLGFDPIEVNTYRFKNGLGQPLSRGLKIKDMTVPRMVKVEMSCYQEFVCVAMRMSCMSHGPRPSLAEQRETNMFSTRVYAVHMSGFDLVGMMEERLNLLERQVQQLQERLEALELRTSTPPRPTPGSSGQSGLPHTNMDASELEPDDNL